jgi:hypothetical protein
VKDSSYRGSVATERRDHQVAATRREEEP